MVNDELLYELMDEISDKDCLIIENVIEEVAHNKNIKKTVMRRIYAEPEGRKRKVVSFKKKFVLAVASAFMVFGVMACARKYDWDIEFAQTLGFPNAMEELKGGYVKIGVTDKQGDIEITAVQALGDKHNQWIQFDSNIPWEIEDEDNEFYRYGKYDISISYGWESDFPHNCNFYSYDNNGYLSIMMYIGDSMKINRARVKIMFGDIYKYNKNSGEKSVVSDGTWELEWSNYYAANTVKKSPLAEVGDVVISKVELSPVSVHINGYCKERNAYRRIKIDNIIMEDGTIVLCNGTGSYNSNGIKVGTDAIFDTATGVDIKKVKSITINGIVIDI